LNRWHLAILGTVLALLAPAAAQPLDLERARGEYESAGLRTPEGQRAALTYARLAHHLRKFATAKRVLSEFLSAVPEHPEREAARALLDEIRARFQVERSTVGVLLPLSGPYRRFGRRVQQGIEVAAEASPGLTLKFKDTKGDPAEARRAVEELILRDHPIAILGPVGEKESLAAAEVAERYQVPILTLTRREGITQIGSFVFRNYLTNEIQGRTMARYAVQVLGLRRFAILYPRNAYGDENMRAFWDEAVKLGGTIRAVEHYSAQDQQYQDPVRKLVGSFWLELRPDMWKEGERRQAGRTFRARKKRWERAIKNLRPIVDFDAIFIPDFWNRLTFVLPWLKYYDVEFFTENVVRLDRLKLKYGKKLPKLVWLLGTNGWNSDRLHRRIGDFVWRAVFCDASYPASDDPAWTTFVNRFKEKHARDPHFLQAIGYDSLRILHHVLQKSNAPGREALRDELRKLKDFPGATGLTGFTGGDVEKKLQILTIERTRGDVNRYEIVPASMSPREVTPAEGEVDQPSETEEAVEENGPGPHKRRTLPAPRE
jgi:ABC-type branched-subunit amino acid transport system substrate-binding protein